MRRRPPRSTRTATRVPTTPRFRSLERWPREWAARALIDMAERRNRLLAYIAERWRSAPPSGFVVAAGIATPAPAIAGLLHRVARMQRGMVVLPDLDLNLSPEEWDSIGPFDRKSTRLNSSH